MSNKTCLKTALKLSVVERIVDSFFSKQQQMSAKKGGWPWLVEKHFERKDVNNSLNTESLRAQCLIILRHPFLTISKILELFGWFAYILALGDCEKKP